MDSLGTRISATIATAVAWLVFVVLYARALTAERAKIILKDLVTKILRIFGGIKVTKSAKTEKADAEIDEIAQRILVELESASSKDLSDARYAKMVLRLSDVNYARKVLQQIGSATKQSGGVESNIEKRAVIKVLLFSTWVQRLYFIIRSFIMGEIGAGVTFLFIWYMGSINAIQMFEFGIFVFALTLVITRLFDAQITKATKKIVEIMANHITIRDFIMNHF